MRSGKTSAVCLALTAAALCGPARAAGADDGAALFTSNCQVCHQAGGAGVPGQFPRLAGRVSVITASPVGRSFLSALVLNGMSGRVVVDGQPVLGVMPGFTNLSDAQLSKVLTYVAHLGGKATGPGVKPADIAAARAVPRRSPADMAAQRNQLAAAKVIP